MTVDQLRAALDSYSPWHGMGADAYEDIEVAARRWLSLLEADETIIEKLAAVLEEYVLPGKPTRSQIIADKVLAAITKEDQ